MIWNGPAHEPHHFPTGTEARHRIDRFKAWIAHKPFVHRLLDVALVGAFPGLGAYARFVAPHAVEVTENEFPVPGLPPSFDGFRIVHLSDLHLGKNVPISYLKRCVAHANAARAEIAVLTGDYLQWDPDYVEQLAAILGELRAPMGVYAVLGNHDYGLNSPTGPRLLDGGTARLVSALEGAGVSVLRNRWVPLRIGSDSAYVVGVDDLWSGECNPDAAFDGVPADGPVLFLCHNPDGYGYARRFRFHLLLSGHTHGAQVRLPLLSRQPHLPVRDARFMAGIYGRPGCWVYVNRGLGYIWKVRLNSAPEVACHTLRPERLPGQRPVGYTRLRRHSRR